MAWRQKDLGSLVALPLRHESSPLGALVLYHKDAHHFTEERVMAAQTLLSEAHPFLRRARSLASRDAWDSMIFHEVRSGLSHIRGQADFVLSPSPSRTAETAAQAILARTELMTDLSSEIMALLGYKDLRLGRRNYDKQHPMALLKEIWNELSGLYEVQEKELLDIGTLPPLPDSLYDPDNALPHVLRVLLDNALRYGDPGKVEPHPSVNARTAQWRLCICNHGKFSKDILDGNFHDLSSREDLAQDSLRAHIGLASCRRVLEDLGGKLELKNKMDDDSPLACCVLIWPLSTNAESKKSTYKTGEQ